MKRLLPPSLFLLSAVLSVTAGLLLPLGPPAGLPLRVFGAVLLAVGLAVTVTGSRVFARVGTNIVTFEDPDVLVTSGLFARTRNPMYLGFLVALIGVAGIVARPAALIGALIFGLAADRWYIPFEERRMRAAFGAAYEQYAARVRRWL